MGGTGREDLEVRAANKHAADEIEAAVPIVSSIEEEMMLEAADLEEVEFDTTEIAAE